MGPASIQRTRFFSTPPTWTPNRYSRWEFFHLIWQHEFHIDDRVL